MACLNKLSVSGIRSFDPEDRQVIKFFPLTLILGSNGAGKTTLIECLRYSATNEFPPFTNKGKTWIHDLHFSKGHTNRGQVKLAFTDINGVECVITRSIELTAKRDRSGKVVPQMRTLDAIIKRGDDTIVSTKCVQIDSVMLDLIGVSKSVLSDVIFCHQEDSNWPLSESKVLKEKFDQLFGSAGYVKALKKIKDERTEYAKRLAQYEGEVKLFQEHKLQAEKYNNSLAKCQATLASYKDKMNTLNSEIIPIKKELESLAAKEKVIVDVERVISGLEGKLNEQKKSIEYLRDNIRETFNGTKEELKMKMANFADDTKMKDSQLKKTESELDKAEDDLCQLNAQLNRISTSKGKLEGKQVKFSQDKKKLKTILQKLLDEGLSEFDCLQSIEIEENTETALAEIQNSVDSQKDKLESELKSTLCHYEKSLKEVDLQLDRLKSSKSKLEQSIAMNNKSIMEKTEDANRIQLQLKEISHSSGQLKEISSQLEEKKEQRKKLESEFDIDQLQLSIQEMYEDQKTLKDKIDNLNKEKDSHIAQNEARAVLQVHIKNKEKEQDNLTSIYSEYVNLLQDLGIDENDADKSFVDELKNKIRASERKLKTKETAGESLNADRRKLETQLEMVKMKYENCKKEIKEKETKMRSICGSTPFDQMLDSVDSELKSLRSKSATSSGAESLLSEYSVIIENEAKCPVCETDLKSNRTKVKDSLVKKIRQLPLEAKKVNEELSKKEKLHEKLLGLKSEYESIKNNKELMPKIKQEVFDVQKKLDEIISKIQTHDRELKKDKFELDRLRSAEPQAISYDNSLRSLQDIENRIEQCKRELGTVDSTLRSLDDVRGELDDFINDAQQLEDELKKYQEEKDEATKLISQVKEQIFALEDQKLKLERGQSKQVALTEKCSELRQQVNSLENELITFEDEIKSIEPRLEQLIERRKSVVDEKESKRKQSETIISKLNRYLDDFAAIGEDIASYLMDDIDAQLKDLQEKFNQIKRDINQINDDKSNLSKICNSLRKEINEVELGERNLKDNLELLERIEKVTEYEKKLSKEIEKRGAADSVALQKKKQQLEKQFQEKYQQLQQIKGKQEPIIAQIQDLERDLSSEKYVKAKTNLQSKLIESVEMETICEDLNKLYRALDHSVMVFHKKKMAEINQYLSRLWRDAYRGNDIDFIKIESDTETERSASDKRRSFNYRVVMVREQVEMDMRGRCSAGQKVIASLIIRLALAEIFSINCGILALDEPTTNLDKDNIQAFADTVTNIVKLHRHHRFQLVIITHDDQFLRCLRDSGCEQYYQVYKNDKGNSRIMQMSIRDID